MSIYKKPIRSDELYHHGILGMHWGIRRYQNKDGSLTSAGRARYDRAIKKAEKRSDKIYRKSLKDKRIAAMTVYDKDRDEHIGVRKETFKKKGKQEAINEAHDPLALSKIRKIESSYYNKMHDEYKRFIKDEDIAYKKAIENIQNNTGLTKKYIMKILKESSDVKISDFNRKKGR